jgi:hypothetical protein
MGKNVDVDSTIINLIGVGTEIKVMLNTNGDFSH